MKLNKSPNEQIDERKDTSQSIFPDNSTATGQPSINNNAMSDISKNKTITMTKIFKPLKQYDESGDEIILSGSDYWVRTINNDKDCYYI